MTLFCALCGVARRVVADEIDNRRWWRCGFCATPLQETEPREARDAFRQDLKVKE